MRDILLLLVFSTSLYADLLGQMNSDYETEDAIRKWSNGYFGVKPHYPNFLLPFGLSNEVYKSYVLSDEYTNKEAQLQVSLKLLVTDDLLGLDEEYFLAYTHTAFWQVYTDSSPFRETNYNPEAFVVIPMQTKVLPALRSVEIALAHISNGQGDNRGVVYPVGYDNPGHRSRSVNYAQFSALFQVENFYTKIKLWLPNRYKNDLEDNRDIMDYYGYSSVHISYFYNKNMLTLMGRLNPQTGFGAIEGTYSYPVDIYDDVYFYVKGFSGYGESLIDYNNNISKISVGFSFSR